MLPNLLEWQLWLPFQEGLSDKYDSGKLASMGMSIIVIGLIVLTFLDENTHMLLIIPALAILGLGFGLFLIPKYKCNHEFG